MAIGGILAYINLSIRNSKINNLLSFTAVAAILINVFIIDDESMFPGFWALVPTLSSACIIQARGEAFINKYVLSSKPFVFIGKISYSLYLWHWPILIFSHRFFPHGSRSLLGNTYFILLLIVILTILTYYMA